MIGKIIRNTVHVLVTVYFSLCRCVCDHVCDYVCMVVLHDIGDIIMTYVA